MRCGVFHGNAGRRNLIGPIFRVVSLMDRPTIFLSSTIYDFRDLRSAIKDHLEENGCCVLASDYNDFTKPLDVHSYETCLRTIEQADYFLLLIGTRVGGWYDLDNRVSITQQEYRTAYRLAQEGKINCCRLFGRKSGIFVGAARSSPNIWRAFLS